MSKEDDNKSIHSQKSSLSSNTDRNENVNLSKAENYMGVINLLEKEPQVKVIRNGNVKTSIPGTSTQNLNPGTSTQEPLPRKRYPGDTTNNSS